MAVPSDKPPQTIPFGTNWKHWKAGNRIHGNRVLISLVEETWNINMLRDAFKHVFLKKNMKSSERTHLRIFMKRIAEKCEILQNMLINFWKTVKSFFMKFHIKHSKKPPNFGRKVAVKVLGKFLRDFLIFPNLSRNSTIHSKLLRSLLNKRICFQIQSPPQWKFSIFYYFRLIEPNFQFSIKMVFCKYFGKQPKNCICICTDCWRNYFGRDLGFQ